MRSFVTTRLVNFPAAVACRRFRAEEDGQTLVEYGLILGLLSIAAIAGVTLLGGTLNDLFNDIVGQLGGSTTTTTT
jgi:pilus assembly protein Flp/PilA